MWNRTRHAPSQSTCCNRAQILRRDQVVVRAVALTRSLWNRVHVTGFSEAMGSYRDARVEYQYGAEARPFQSQTQMTGRGWKLLEASRRQVVECGYSRYRDGTAWVRMEFDKESAART